MKHTNSKFFIMFLAGILFSAITVFAATITIPSNIASNAVQFLQQLVLTDASGTTTGVVLNGDGDSYVMGNFGIGTNSPSSELEIVGHIAADSIESNGDIDAQGDLDVDGALDVGGLINSVLDVNSAVTILYTDNLNVSGNIAAEEGHFRNGLSIVGETIMSGALHFISNSTKTPSIFATGLSSPGVYDMELKTSAGKNILLNTNNVGIGTSSPTAKLDVEGTGKFNELDIDGPISTSSNIYAKKMFLGTYLGSIPPLVPIIEANLDGDMILNGANIWNNNRHVLLATTSGRVGIGTDTPVTKLDVAGRLRIDDYLYFSGGSHMQEIQIGGKNDIKIKAGNGGGDTFIYGGMGDTVPGGITGGNVYINGGIESPGFYLPGTPYAGGDVIIGHNGSVEIKSNVGIGTDAPTTKLDVNGIISLGNETTTCESIADGGKLRYTVTPASLSCTLQEVSYAGSSFDICLTTGSNDRGWIRVEGVDFVDCYDPTENILH